MTIQDNSMIRPARLAALPAATSSIRCRREPGETVTMRGFPTRPTRRLGAMLGLVLLTACAGQSPTRSGFLSSYDGMAPTADHTRDLIFIDPGYAQGRYTRVVVETIAWHPAPGTPERTPEEIADLRQALRSRLVAELGKSFTIVEPGDAASGMAAGTLRVRAAITNTRRANWWINAPVQVAGIGLAVAGVPGGVPPPNPGGASIEMEAVDGADGRRMVAIATYANGVPWAPMGYYTRFGHARRAFDLASELLRRQLAPASSPA